MQATYVISRDNLPSGSYVYALVDPRDGKTLLQRLEALTGQSIRA